MSRSLRGWEAPCLVLVALLAALSLRAAPPIGSAAAPPAGGASAPSPADAAAPFVLVLGTAQDGGLPHPGCTCERCEAARRDPTRRRLVASLAIVFPNEHKVYLIDATPDLREQLDRVRPFRPGPPGRVDRAPVDGVLLTHAHIGHYLGLAFFGFEAVSTHDLPAWATPRMAAFLRGNGPWSLLVERRNLDLREMPPGEPFRLEGRVTVTPFAVPHRDELSDTVGFLLAGPSRRVLYVPDTDAWGSWARPLPEVAAGADLALVDGTFFSPDELPGRPVASIGHPLMTATMDLLAPLVASGRLVVFFTHLNHSNPALDPASAARRQVEARGFHVLEDGARLPL